MQQAVDWEETRREKFANVETPASWPSNVKPVSIAGIALLGVGSDGGLYWDGKKLQTETRLAKFERGLGLAVAGSSIALAAVEFLRFCGYRNG